MDYESKITVIMSEMRTGSRYNALGEAERKGRIVDYLTKQFKRRGQSASGGSIVETADYLDDDVMRYYGNTLTAGEVMTALDWGLHGEFGEFTGINADRLFKFVRSYATSSERRDAAQRLRVMSSGSGPRALTTGEIGRLNWDSSCRYALKAYGDFCETGSLPGTAVGKGGMAGALVIAQRHNEANAYRWLKAVGIVAEDDGTRKVETDVMRRAEETLRRAGLKSEWPQTKVLGEAILLQKFFQAVKSSGFDFEGRMKEVETIPINDRLFW